MLFSWFIFKTIRILDDKSNSSLLDLSLACLLDKNIDNKLFQFEFICYQNQILSSNMIRMKTIKPHIIEKVHTSKLDLNLKNNCSFPKKLIAFINESGDNGIWQYLSTLNIPELNAELILQLDAIRSDIQYPLGGDDWLFENFLNHRKNIVKTEC